MLTPAIGAHGFCAFALVAACARPTVPDPGPEPDARVPCSPEWVVETVAEVGLFRDSLTFDEAMVAAGPSGEAHVVWLDRYARDVRRARRDGAGWTIDTVATVVPSDEWTNTGVVVDEDGAAHVTWFAADGALRYATEASGGWVTTTVSTPEAFGSYGNRVALSLDPDDRPVMLWAGGRSLWWARPGEPAEILFDAFDVSVYSIHHHGVLFDDAGVVHLAFFGAGFDAVYATASGETRSWEVVDEGIDTGMYASVALTPDGTPHVAYAGPDLASTWHIRRGDGGWPEIPSEPTLPWASPSMLADPNGRLVLAGVDRADPAGPAVATWTVDAWNVEMIPGGDEAARETALAIDSLGTLHVTWWDGAGKRIRYAQRCTR
jgi:hypothetical protein